MEISLNLKSTTFSTDAPSLILANKIEHLYKHIQLSKKEVDDMQQEVHSRIRHICHMEIELESIKQALNQINNAKSNNIK